MNYIEEVVFCLKNRTEHEIWPTVRKLKATEDDISSGKFSNEHVNTVLRPRADGYRDVIKQAKAQAQDSVWKIIKEEKEKRAQREKLDWAALPDDAGFLRFDFLDADDLMELAGSHGENPVMLRLIGSYAKNRGLEYQGAPLEELIQKNQDHTADAVMGVAKMYLDNHATTDKALETLDAMLGRFIG